MIITVWKINCDPADDTLLEVIKSNAEFQFPDSLFTTFPFRKLHNRSKSLGSHKLISSSGEQKILTVHTVVVIVKTYKIILSLARRINKQLIKFKSFFSVSRINRLPFISLIDMLCNELMTCFHVSLKTNLFN
jgi:hypothetical protein